MKQAMNFRLSRDAVTILALLKEELKTSNTSILEKALLSYAKKKLSAEQPLLKFAGKLGQKDAQKILSSIHSSRRNKKKDTEL